MVPPEANRILLGQMISVREAIKIIERETTPLGVERVALCDSVGRVLAEDVVADMDLPPFDRSQMDGYAVIAKDTANAPVALKIVGESAAGHGWHKTMKRGEAVRIMTGAAVPKGADSVQKVEVTSESDGVVTVNEPVAKGFSVVKKGSEIKAGKLVVKSGERVSESMIATLAAFGYAKVKVAKQPRIAIIGTGSEIVDVSRKPKRDQIRNSNSVMLDVLSRKFGCVATPMPTVKDDISDLKFQISNSAKDANIVILTGGVSVGKYDHTKTALTEIRAEIFFDKVSLKPGKPAVFAKLGKTLIFGLPGNPVSAAVTFHLFVHHAILKMQSASISAVQGGHAVVNSAIKAARDRDTYLPVGLATDDRGLLIATPLRSQGSSDLVSIGRADAFAFVGAGERVDAGQPTKIVYI